MVQKPGEIMIFRTFLAKFSILAHISLKMGYIEFSHDYDLTVMSYVGGWFLFWFVWKITLSILCYQLHVSGGFHFQVQGVVTPLGRRDRENRLRKTRVNRI